MERRTRPTWLSKRGARFKVWLDKILMEMDNVAATSVRTRRRQKQKKEEDQQ